MRIKNFFNLKIVWLLFVLIIIIATSLRFWQLGAVPISPDWDEVSLGYNAYSILHTGRDEYGKVLPIVLKSFGDYKPALYAYLDIPAIELFGFNTFAVRFPSAFLGTLTVLITFFLIKELFKKDSVALLVSFLLAISPWHIQFSRVAFETNVGLFFNVLGVFLFLKGLKKPWLLIFSVSAFALNLYIYQSEKVFSPLLFILLCIIYNKALVKISKKIIIFALMVGICIILPISFYTFFNPNGLARAQGVSVFSSTKIYQTITNRYLFNKMTHDNLGVILDNSRLIYAKIIIGNYLSHFDFNWLFITGDINRHHAPNMGLLYLWELPFMLIGIYELIFGKYDKKVKIIILGWFLIAPIPASITNDVPHAVRTLNFLPMFQIFTALGILGTLKIIAKNNKLMITSVILLTLISLFNFAYYLDQYFVQQNYFYAKDWQYGFSDIVSSTKQLEKPYQQVVVDSTNQMSQSYIFYLFYLQYNPYLYQKEVNNNTLEVHYFDKYVFRPINWDKDQNLKNILFVGNAGNFPDQVQGSKKMIYTKDGKPLMEIVGT